LSTGAWPSTSEPYIVAENFATDQRSLSFNFTKEKNVELFNSTSGERYYSLLFNVKNRGVENSVLSTIYHLPANIDSVTVEDYYTPQVSGLVNQVLTSWSYTGNASTTSFDITGAQNPFITGFTALPTITTWTYFPTGDVSGFAITGYSDSGNFYDVYSGELLVSLNEYQIKFSPPEVNFYTLASGFDLQIFEKTGITGFLSTNYQVFVDGFEEFSGDYLIDGNDQKLLFYNPPSNNSSILIQETTGINQLITGALTGQVNFTVNFDSGSLENYIVRSLDVYTGTNIGQEHSVSGFGLLKTVNFLQSASSQNFSILAEEVPTNQFVYYKFIPNDDFGPGYIFNSGVSGYLFQPTQQLFYTNAIPPTLSFEARTGNFFTGLNSPQSQPDYDGALIYQTGSSGQNLYLVKSGQWKTVLPYEELSGIFDLQYVTNSQTGQFVSTGSTGSFIKLVVAPQFANGNGKIGEIAFSGTYLYAATGTNQWGRVQLSSW
jgi:hypothetical protein